MMKPCTITHISTVHPAFDIRIFHKECKSLANLGMNVNLIVTHNKTEIVDNVRIIPLPEFKNRFTRMFIKPFFAFSKALKTKADFFHFHDPELVPIGLLLKICGKKVIYDVHEDSFSIILVRYWIPKNLRVLTAFIFRNFELFASQFFDGIVAATPHIHDIFIKKNKNTINVNNYPLLEEMRALEVSQEKKREKQLCD